MPDLDRLVGGIRCRGVLASLSEYLDGELVPAEVERIERHLSDCDHCERFGGQVAGVIAEVRRSLLGSATKSEGRRERLVGRMRSIWSNEGEGER